MATTNIDPAINSSGQIRTLIGSTKRRLLAQVELCKQLFLTFNSTLDNVDVTSLSDTDLQDFHQDATEVREQILKHYSKIDELHNNWMVLKNNPSEEKVFAEYIQKCGDYRLQIEATVSTLQKLDNGLESMENSMRQRKMPIFSKTRSMGSDEDVSSAHDAAFWNKTSSPLPTQYYPPGLEPHTMPHQSPNVNARVSQYQPQNPQGLPMPFNATSPMMQQFNATTFVDAAILSKLELPCFSGDIMQFPEFWSRFSTLVGNKPELAGATKLSLLLGCLQGRAAESVAGLPTNDASYTIATDILRTLYEDPATTRHIIFTKLLNLPSCDTDGKNLLSFYNQIFALVRQYTAYGGDSKEYGLGTALLNKLPKHIRGRIYDKAGNANLTPAQLLDHLTSIVRKESTLQEQEKYQRNVSFNVKSQTFQVTVQNNQKRAPDRRPDKKSNTRFHGCKLCDASDHNVFKCEQYPSPKERLTAAKRKNLCINCLNDSHATKDCPSKNVCKECSKKHHTSLCFRPNTETLPEGKNQSTRGNNQPAHGQRKKHSKPQSNQPQHRNERTHYAEPDYDACDPREEDPVDESTMAAVEKMELPENDPKPNEPGQEPKSSVILMCADAMIFNPSDPTKRIKTTVFLDTGSSKTYMTKGLADQLQLSSDRLEELRCTHLDYIQRMENQSS